jgi:DNA-binding NarL/FixJ family response regulator
VVVGCRDEHRAAALERVLTLRGRSVVIESCSVENLVALAVESEAAVLVLDGALPGSALRAVAHAAESTPGIAVLVLGPLRPNLEVLIALASRISGYLPADSSPEAVADAVDALSAGEVVLPKAVSLPLVAHLHRGGRGVTAERGDGQLVELTHREWEVFVLVRQAHTTAEIAERLVISPVTVRTHIAALVHKLGVRTRHELAEPPAGRGR